MDRLLGEGSFGSVYLANKDDKKYACKIMNIPKKKELLENLENEISIL